MVNQTLPQSSYDCCDIIIIIIIIIIINITNSSFQYSPSYLPSFSPCNSCTRVDQQGQWCLTSSFQIPVSLCCHQIDSSLGSDDPMNTLRMKSRRAFAVRGLGHLQPARQSAECKCSGGEETRILSFLSQYVTKSMHKICFTISFISCLYMFRAYVLIIRSKLHYTTYVIITLC